MITSDKQYVDKMKFVETLQLSDAELADRKNHIEQLTDAYNQKQLRYTEIDDQTPEEYYMSNKKADIGYIPPRKNAEEVQTVTGTTREKDNSLLSSFLGYSFEADIEAYDESSLPDHEFSQILEDLVRKSRKLECPTYDVKRPLIYREFIAQGTVLTLEKWVELQRVRKQIDNLDVDNLSKLKWSVKSDEIDSYCNTELISFLNTYPGNMREFFIEKQPFMGFQWTRTRSEAFAMYGEFDRWKNVPSKLERMTPENHRQFDDWQMLKLKEGFVDEVWYMNKWNNTFQIYLNGIPMLTVGFPLEYLIGMSEYPVSKGDSEPISHTFFLSRSVPAKTKMNQYLIDEFFRLMITKTRRSHKPPISNMTGQRLSDKIFQAGAILDGVDADKIKVIGTNDGVTPPEFNMFELVRKMIDESSVSPVFQGNTEKGDQTKYEVATLEKNTLVKIGLAVLGIVNLERSMAWLRLPNILNHWAAPIDKKVVVAQDGTKKEQDVYRTEVVNTTLEDGSKGQKVIQFQKGNLPHPMQAKSESEILSKRRGKNIEMVYIDADGFQSLKYKYYIEIISTEKVTGELRKVMKEQSILKMLEVFPDTTNREYAQQEIARDNKLDVNKIIKKAAPPMMPPMAPGAGPVAPGNDIAKQLQPSAPPQPSINTLVNA